MNTSRVNVGANTFPPERDYSLLTLKDLLEARDHYHVHLAHLPNVVATAVGRYLIIEKDPTAHHRPHTTKGRPSERSSRQPRTLFNSVVKEWSWPCVLVFVDKWLSRRQFARHPDCMVPRALYLPDGRVVPTCTVLVHEAEEPPCPDYHLSFANSFLGGGYLTFSDVQGEEHIGSVGCLVSDGDLTYALTNRHVTGAAGRELFTMFSGKRRRIGVSDRNHLTLKNFTDMYPTWPGKNVKVHLDAGLIRIDDKRDWTTQVAGMGPLAEWIDINTDTLTLDIIDSRLRAFGAASGELRGRIAALFYRYSTAGGTDYVTEFLIRPESLADQGTQHGDSGTLWFFEERKNPASPNPDSLRPCAMQWGGHVWVNGRSCQRVGRFALATCLSTVCRELNVTLLRDWNTGLPEYWGPVGHYTIGFFACQGIGGKLGTLMKANQTTVSYPLDSISSRTKINEKGPSGLVPLADVPDRLWAHGKTLRGGADKPNHFADMDKPDPKKGNKTLLQLCAEDPSRVTPDFWLEYYADIGDKGRGLLPFRVWQFFDEMVDAVKKHDATRFVAAAGILAHYVGDACQPLHCSFLHHGDRPGATDSSGDDVHTAYEESMLRKNAVEFLTMMTNAAANPGPLIKPPASGQQAAQATVALMQRTFKTISPREIVDAFNDSQALWPLFGVRTVKVMGDGIRTLQAIWRGAWKQGGGDTSIVETKLKAAPPTDLIALYMRKTWMPSKTLRTIGSVLK